MLRSVKWAAKPRVIVDNCEILHNVWKKIVVILILILFFGGRFFVLSNFNVDRCWCLQFDFDFKFQSRIFDDETFFCSFVIFLFCSMRYALFLDNDWGISWLSSSPVFQTYYMRVRVEADTALRHRFQHDAENYVEWEMRKARKRGRWAT